MPKRIDHNALKGLATKRSGKAHIIQNAERVIQEAILEAWRVYLGPNPPPEADNFKTAHTALRFGWHQDDPYPGPPGPGERDIHIERTNITYRFRSLW